MSKSDCQRVIDGLACNSASLPLPYGTPLALSSSQYISLYMPRLDNSADSPQSYQNDCFAWTSTALQASSVRTLFIIEAIPALQGHAFPCGLHNSLCTLHLYCSSISVDSATGATLDTGGWLDLTRQGLAPCKMHQA